MEGGRCLFEGSRPLPIRTGGTHAHPPTHPLYHYPTKGPAIGASQTKPPACKIVIAQRIEELVKGARVVEQLGHLPHTTKHSF